MAATETGSSIAELAQLGESDREPGIVQVVLPLFMSNAPERV